MKEGNIIVAADIGGSHITAAQVDINTRQLLPATLVRNKVDSNGSAKTIINSWSACLTEAASGVEVAKFCLAVPGPFDYSCGISLISNQNKYPALFGLNVKEMLSKSLKHSSENIFFHNDAASFVHGEVFAGEARGFNKVIGLTLGTGVGTAVYENNFSYSADLWNLPFKEGIAEDYLSSRWFVKRYYEITSKHIQGVMELIDNSSEKTVREKIFKEFGSNLGGFLVEFISLHVPEAVVIGGNIANAFSFFGDAVKEAIGTAYPQLCIMQSKLGEHAALLGAAASAALTAAKN